MIEIGLTGRSRLDVRQHWFREPQLVLVVEVAIRYWEDDYAGWQETTGWRDAKPDDGICTARIGDRILCLHHFN